MKKIFSTVIVFSALLFGGTAQAICINCGCSSNYKACMKKAALADDSGLVDNDDGSFTYAGSEAECKQLRKDCHGSGVKIRL